MGCSKDEIKAGTEKALKAGYKYEFRELPIIIDKVSGTKVTFHTKASAAFFDVVWDDGESVWRECPNECNLKELGVERLAVFHIKYFGGLPALVRAASRGKWPDAAGGEIGPFKKRTVELVSLELVGRWIDETATSTVKINLDGLPLKIELSKIEVLLPGDPRKFHVAAANALLRGPAGEKVVNLQDGEAADPYSDLEVSDPKKAKISLSQNGVEGITGWL